MSVKGELILKVLLGATGIGLAGYGIFLGVKYVQSKLPDIKNWWEGVKSKITDPFGLKAKLGLTSKNDGMNKPSSIPLLTSGTVSPLIAPAAVTMNPQTTQALANAFSSGTTTAGNVATTLIKEGRQGISDLLNSKPVAAVTSWAQTKPLQTGLSTVVTGIKDYAATKPVSTGLQNLNTAYKSTEFAKNTAKIGTAITSGIINLFKPR